MASAVRGLSMTTAELQQTGKRIPWKPVLTALGLLCVGSVMLAVVRLFPFLCSTHLPS